MSDDLRDLLAPLDGAHGPARRLSKAQSSALVRSIVDAAQAAPAPAPAPVVVVAPPRRGRVMLLAAAIVIATAGVAAATGAWVATREPVTSRADDVPPPTKPAKRVVTPPPPVVVEEPPVVEIDEPPPRPRPESPRAVDDLLADANAARKARDWRAAVALYDRVIKEHRGTDAAVVATVAAASLRLDRLADPAGARRGFRRALDARPDGPLAEESRWGLAQAERALGNTAAETAALRAFIGAHPDSPRLDDARRRLAELAP